MKISKSQLRRIILEEVKREIANEGIMDFFRGRKQPEAPAEAPAAAPEPAPETPQQIRNRVIAKIGEYIRNTSSMTGDSRQIPGGAEAADTYNKNPRTRTLDLKMALDFLHLPSKFAEVVVKAYGDLYLDNFDEINKSKDQPYALFNLLSKRLNSPQWKRIDAYQDDMRAILAAAGLQTNPAPSTAREKRQNAKASTFKYQMFLNLARAYKEAAEKEESNEVKTILMAVALFFAARGEDLRGSSRVRAGKPENANFGKPKFIEYEPEDQVNEARRRARRVNRLGRKM